jgi:hypothetical protein
MHYQGIIQHIIKPYSELNESTLTMLSQFLVTTVWNILRLKMKESLQMSRVAENILNTQFQTGEFYENNFSYSSFT